MAGYIPEQQIDAIRERADIVEIVSSYVALTRAGRLYKGLCPFHAEKTPSFVVNPERRIFHCFGCGVGGNVFRFLMLHKSISFPEAVAELAERYGFEIRNSGGPGPRERLDKTSIYKAVALAQKFFVEELHGDSGHQAREYLEKRGLPRKMIEEFHLGWAPPGWDNLTRFLEAQKVPVEVMEKAGLVKPRPQSRGAYDTFRARVIMPICDLDGKTVAFGGRLLAEEEQQPKYLNSPETPIYSKGRLLYGLSQCRPLLREIKTVLIVEGYFDLLSLVASGVRHVVATLGTALTPAHLNLLKGYVNRAIVVFDADEAGRSAAARALPIFMSADLDGRVLRLPDGHDPDTFIRSFGPAALTEALNDSEGLLDFYLDKTLARYPETLAGRSRAAQEVLGTIGQVEGHTRRDLLRRALAERLGISEESLRLSERRRENAPEARNGLVETVAADFELELLRLVLLHPETAREIFSAEIGSLFLDPGLKKVYEVMAFHFNRDTEINLERLVEELDPEEADLITGLAMSDDGLTGQDLDLVVADYLKRFSLRRRRLISVDLSKRIKQAQAAGDRNGLTSLLDEKNRLLREGI